MYYANWPTTGGGYLCYGIGLVSSVEWLHGFIIFVHWTWMLPGNSQKRVQRPVPFDHHYYWYCFVSCCVGPKNVPGLVAALLKTTASVFFCIFPATGLLENACTWSNLVGIILFHSGNMVDTATLMKRSCNYKRCCDPGNYVTINMFVKRLWSLLRRVHWVLI